MRRLLFLLGLVFCAAHARAAVFADVVGKPIAVNAQGALNSCGNGNTLQLSAGTTTVTSSVTLP